MWNTSFLLLWNVSRSLSPDKRKQYHATTKRSLTWFDLATVGRSEKCLSFVLGRRSKKGGKVKNKNEKLIRNSEIFKQSNKKCQKFGRKSRQNGQNVGWKFGMAGELEERGKMSTSLVCCSCCCGIRRRLGWKRTYLANRECQSVNCRSQENSFSQKNSPIWFCWNIGLMTTRWASRPSS